MKILIITFFVLLCFEGFAQEKFIEVTVSDTAWVKPDNFIYRISVNTTDDEYAEVDTLVYTDPGAYKQKRKQKQLIRNTMLDSVTQLIKEKGYRILPPTIAEAFLIAGEVGYNSNSILVITGSVDSLRSLYNLVSGNVALQANVESVFAKDESPDRKYLYKKLLAQAAKNATAIAELTGKKAGKVVSVTEFAEAKSESPGGWTVYPPLSAMASSVIPGWHTTIKGNSIYNLTEDRIVTTYLIHNTLTVRFGLE
jgi:Protein of unknown function (DUF541)